ncbi:MAG: hypothetical protein ACWGMZ_03065 [Thermoguttaceae bacterium]
MPAQYKRSGFSFLYPENWVVEEEETIPGRQAVTVYSPGGGFWSLAVYQSAMDPLKMANAAVDAMKEEYKDLEVEATSETLAGCEMHGFDLNFFLFDFINTAQIRGFRHNRSTYTILCQAEDSEFVQTQKVFQAMTTSLIQAIEKL